MIRQEVDISVVSTAYPLVPLFAHPIALLLQNISAGPLSQSRRMFSESIWRVRRDSARRRSLHFPVRGPAQADRHRTAVILSLDRELLTALIKPQQIRRAHV